MSFAVSLMSRSRPSLAPELHAFLEFEREILPVSHAARAHAIARACASLTTDCAMPRARVAPLAKIGWPFVLGAMGTVYAVACAAGCELGGWHLHAVPSGKATTPVVAAAGDPYLASPATAVVPSSTAAAAGPVGRPSRAEPEEPEELLLSEARSAVADLDFAAALVPLNEHARRFESNPFAEEREALLIRTLAGLGRTEEARRAAGAFRTRFPSSTLFPAGPGIAASGE